MAGFGKGPWLRALCCGLVSCSAGSWSRTASVTEAPRVPLFAVTGVATWRGDATAAYSLIHDDVCDDNLDTAFSIAAPELKKRGLHAGFGTIVGRCQQSGVDKWPAVRALVEDGHDVFSHSWSHPCLDADPERPPEQCPRPPDVKYSADLVSEIERAGETLRAQTGVALDYFIFPYDYCAPRALTYLKEHGYLGARCGATEAMPINEPGFADPFGAFFDVFGPAYSYYWDRGPCRGKVTQFTTPPYGVKSAPADCVEYVENQYVADTIARKGWGIREFHGFHPGLNDAFEPITRTDYTKHLDYLQAQSESGALWVEGPSRVLRYRFARDACPLPTLVGERTLHFAPASAACLKYRTVLSYLITADAARSAPSFVMQAGHHFALKHVSAGHLVVDADPAAGDAELMP